VQVAQQPLTFELMLKKAGPPPLVGGCEFWQDGCEAASGGGKEADFDISLGLFKRGQGPPPTPLPDYSRTPCKSVLDYYAWYNNWGSKLRVLWDSEHPVQKLQKTYTAPKTRTPEEPEYTPRRVGVAEVCEQSGW
jgi:hypothetical protein